MEYKKLVDHVWGLVHGAIQNGTMLPSTATRRLVDAGYTQQEAVLEVSAIKNGSVERTVTPRLLIMKELTSDDELVAIVFDPKEVLPGSIEIFDFMDEELEELSKRAV